MDTLLSMRMFLRVVEAGGFGAAADQMNCSTASVSRAVSMLEDRLCTRLLHRTTRSFSLTEAGQLYYARSRRILSDLDDAEAQAGGAHALPRGKLHVECALELGLRRLTQSIVEYRRQHPGVGVHVSFVPALSHPIEDRVDVSIVTAASLSDSESVSRVVGEIRHVLVAEPAYLKACRITSFDQLAEHALTPIPARVSSQAHHARLGVVNPASTVRKAALVIDDPEAVRFAVLAGAGVAALPLHCVSADIRLGSLVQLFPEHHLPCTRVFALYASHRNADAKIRTFVDFVASHFARVQQVNPSRRTVAADDGTSHSPSTVPRCPAIETTGEAGVIGAIQP
jgi:DNA-binding transcriptional LysR family regulator